MAYNTKEIIKDKDGNPISQYYNPETDQYEPVEGQAGANKVVLYNADGTENNNLSLIPILEKLSQLTGTVIDEDTRKSNEIIRQDNEQLRVQLYNDLMAQLDRIEQIQEQVPETVIDSINALKDKLGELQDLDTAEKSNLVLALNEIYNDLVAHKADFAFYRFGDRPYTSVKNTTYYIDEINGNDENDGESEETAFKTWEKCFSQIPIFLNHDYTINIIGNYSGNIRVNRIFANWGVIFTLKGITENADNHVVGEISFGSCFANTNRIICQHFKLVDKGIFISNSFGIAVVNCKPQRSGSSGINIDNSFCYIGNCDFGTDIVQDAIVATHNSKVISSTNTGNATRYGLRVTFNGTIGKVGAQPTGTTSDESQSTGGVIR